MFTFPPKRILVPMDLSEVSRAAWNDAQGLALRFDAAAEAAYVSHWTPLFPEDLPVPSLLEDLRRQARAQLRSEIGTKARLHLCDGDVLSRLLKLLRAGRFDLIVMGTHGRRGLERLLLGSVAETMVRYSPVPVLVVRGALKPVHSVLVPMNFEPYSVSAFRYAAETAAALGAPLTALYAGPHPGGDPSPAFLYEAMLARLPEPLRAACRPDLQLSGASPVTAILKAARSHGLIVLASHRKPLLGELVLGTTAERVLRHSPVPVLAVPSPYFSQQRSGSAAGASRPKEAV